MEPEYEPEELIEKYLTSTLTEEERKIFARKRAEEPPFARAVEFHEDLRIAATHSGKSTLKDRLRELEANREPRQRIIPLRRYLAVAAGILLLIAAGAFWSTGNYYHDEALFAAHRAAPNFSGSRGETEQSSYRQAAAAYYAGDYLRTIRLLTAGEVAGTRGLMPSLLLAHAYLGTDQPENVPELIQSYRTTSPADWDWVEVLYFTRTGNRLDLRAKLITIATDNDHPYQQQAQEMLPDLQSRWRAWVR